MGTIVNARFLVAESFDPRFVHGRLFLMVVKVAVTVMLGLFCSCRKRERSLVHCVDRARGRLRVLLYRLTTCLRGGSVRVGI